MRRRVYQRCGWRDWLWWAAQMGDLRRLAGSVWTGSVDRRSGGEGGVVTEIDGARLSLEVRWMFGGGLPWTVVEWLGPFRSAVEAREDRYLIEARLANVSVKIRGACRLDVKVLQGSRGQ